jgi:hypothetical protein
MKMGEQEQLEAAKQISAHITKAGKGDCNTLLNN